MNDHSLGEPNHMNMDDMDMPGMKMDGMDMGKGKGVRREE